MVVLRAPWKGENLVATLAEKKVVHSADSKGVTRVDLLAVHLVVAKVVPLDERLAGSKVVLWVAAKVDLLVAWSGLRRAEQTAEQTAQTRAAQRVASMVAQRAASRALKKVETTVASWAGLRAEARAVQTVANLAERSVASLVVRRVGLSAGTRVASLELHCVCMCV